MTSVDPEESQVHPPPVVLKSRATEELSTCREWTTGYRESATSAPHDPRRLTLPKGIARCPSPRPIPFDPVLRLAHDTRSMAPGHGRFCRGAWPNGPTTITGARSMKSESFTTSFTVDQTPQQVFDAINDVRGWWSGQVEGGTEKLGDVFSYRVEGVHYSKQRISESVPARRIVWHVLEAELTFVK